MEDYASLDCVFTLPEAIDDVALREMYEILVVRLRREAEHLPMSTVQQLLIERIAYNYVVLRWHESNNTWGSSRAQREYNSFWLNMTSEFNRQLRTTDEEFRNSLLRQVASVITKALEDEPPAVSMRILPKLTTAFEELGM